VRLEPEEVGVGGDEAAPWQLPAEAITVRIRWFGLGVGYFLVNFLSPGEHRPLLNAILTLGAGYALLDTLWSLQRRVFLGHMPLFTSLMEALFIGLLCYFDQGVASPFRFYYFLSLLVCAIRYSPWVTYSTLALHAASYTTLTFGGPEGPAVTPDVVLMLIFMAWVTWAGTALVSLLKAAGRRMEQLNEQLRENQALLENRIAQRTRELQQSQALVVQQEKQAAFGLLAAGIAHEVGNPLAAISSLVQMMSRRVTDKEMYKRLGLVDEQLGRIQRILRELVEFSRPGSTTASFCHLHSVIDGALNIAKYYKRMKGRRILTRYAEGLPMVTLVRDRIAQVFLNLILNALDATEEGDAIEIITSLEQERLVVLIRDEGCGIEPSAQARLFSPYVTTKPTGTGLGLFVSRHILTECGGQIELVETSPQGTTFRVTLTAPELAGGADIPPPPPIGAVPDPADSNRAAGDDARSSTTPPSAVADPSAPG
jgi:two-component system NtrC family sensor kinase